MLRSIFRFLFGWTGVKAFTHDKQSVVSLVGLTASIFVRRPDGSHTDLEQYLESLMLSLGARVVPPNQKAGFGLLRDGDFLVLHSEAHLSIVGTFQKEGGYSAHRKKYTESEYDFKVRKVRDDDEFQCYLRSGCVGPSLVFAPRYHTIVKVDAVRYSFSFRIFGSDGAILVSAICSEIVEARRPKDHVLPGLAQQMINYVDESVWRNVIV